MVETEWDMQRRLTLHWKTNGALLGRNKLFLATWEVMVNSWRINDPHRHWTEPSIDFLFLDISGNIWLVEIKRYVKSPRDAWVALCQITHRAVELTKTYSLKKLEFAFRAAHSGQHGRVNASANVENASLVETHQAFFELDKPVSKDSIGKPSFRRVIGAKEFSPTWSEVKSRFDSSGLCILQKHIRSTYEISKTAKEFKRFLKLQPSEVQPLDYPTESWLLPELNLSGDT